MTNNNSRTLTVLCLLLSGCYTEKEAETAACKARYEELTGRWDRHLQQSDERYSDLSNDYMKLLRSSGGLKGDLSACRNYTKYLEETTNRYRPRRTAQVRKKTK